MFHSSDLHPRPAMSAPQCAISLRACNYVTGHNVAITTVHRCAVDEAQPSQLRKLDQLCRRRRVF